MCDTFISLIDPSCGRIVNLSSGYGSSYVASCNEEQKKFLVSPDVTWEQVVEYVQTNISVTNNPYGLSKAALNSYTMFFARIYPNILSSSVSPGWVKT